MAPPDRAHEPVPLLPERVRQPESLYGMCKAAFDIVGVLRIVHYGEVRLASQPC